MCSLVYSCVTIVSLAKIRINLFYTYAYDFSIYDIYILEYVRTSDGVNVNAYQSELELL